MMALHVYRSPLAPEYPLAIIYEDNHLLFAIKPVGVLSQADRSGKADMLTLLKDYLVTEHHKKGDAWLGLVHRLDQPVGGLMCFAKTSRAASRLAASFRARETEKIYHAVVHGRPESPSGSFVDHLSSEKKGGRYVLDPNGKRAELSYTLLGESPTDGGLSLLRIQLGTGRSHQIRLQCAAHGLPLAGDRRYGRMDAYDHSLASPALFASELALLHPVQKTLLRIVVPLPEGAPWELFTR